MPLSWPPIPSVGIGVANQIAGAKRTFIAKDSAINSLLAIGADELSPHEQRSNIFSQEHHLFSGTDKVFWFATVGVAITTVVTVKDGACGVIRIADLDPRGIPPPAKRNG